MYFENKEGKIDGANARIGWATFSKTGKSIYYRGREFLKIKGGGVSGNYFDVETREEYWISGVKKRGSNTHPAEKTIVVETDEDAKGAYESLRKA